MPRLNVPHRDRLLASATPSNGCLVWQRHVDRHGYGRFKMDGRDWLAHRASYTLFVGPIPDGLTLDHICRNTRCIEPLHLRPLSASANAASRPLRLECKSGHAFSADNIYIWRNKRHCRICRRISSSLYKGSK